MSPTWGWVLLSPRPPSAVGTRSAMSTLLGCPRRGGAWVGIRKNVYPPARTRSDSVGWPSRRFGGGVGGGGWPCHPQRKGSLLAACTLPPPQIIELVMVEGVAQTSSHLAAGQCGGHRRPSIGKTVGQFAGKSRSLADLPARDHSAAWDGLDQDLGEGRAFSKRIRMLDACLLGRGHRMACLLGRGARGRRMSRFVRALPLPPHSQLRVGEHGGMTSIAASKKIDTQKVTSSLSYF